MLYDPVKAMHHQESSAYIEVYTESSTYLITAAYTGTYSYHIPIIALTLDSLEPSMPGRPAGLEKITWLIPTIIHRAWDTI